MKEWTMSSLFRTCKLANVNKPKFNKGKIIHVDPRDKEMLNNDNLTAKNISDIMSLLPADNHYSGLDIIHVHENTAASAPVYRPPILVINEAQQETISGTDQHLVPQSSDENTRT